MTTSPMTLFIEQVRQNALASDGRLSDGELLTRFIDGREEAAFAAIVRRHGPMVWGVCRRLLTNYHDAEDAFQAAFLVLARKPSSVVPRQMVANWLHGVAFTIARRVKIATIKRSMNEKHVRQMPEVAAEPKGLSDDLRLALDGEVRRLANKYRIVFLLCDMGGMTRKEAARQLGCPEGTVAGRLARARRMLARRLARRGIALSGSTLAAALERNLASASVPRLVALSAMRITKIAAAEPVAADVVSVKVAALAEGVLRAMWLKNVRFIAVMIVALVAVGVGTSLAFSGSSEPAPGQSRTTQNQPRQTQAPQHSKPGAGHIFLTRLHDPDPNIPAVGDNEPHIAMVTPDGKEDVWLSKNLNQERQPNHCGSVAVSPDGRQIAYGVTPKEERGKSIHNEEILLKATDNQKSGEKIGVRGALWCWSHDGRSLVVTSVEGTHLNHRLIDLKSHRSTDLQLPEVKASERADLPIGHLITDWSRDRQWFLTTVMAKGQAESELYLVKSDGSDARKLGRGFGGKLSPDGKTALCLDLKWKGDKGEAPDTQLVLIDVTTGKRQRISREINGEFVGGYCWSPDGKKIAYVWRRDRTQENEPWETFLMVMDADGQNGTVVLAEKSSSRGEAWYNPFGWPDWR